MPQILGQAKSLGLRLTTPVSIAVYKMPEWSAVTYMVDEQRALDIV